MYSLTWVEKKATFEAAHSDLHLAVPVYRFWSDKQQSHFYTASQQEKRDIQAKFGKDGWDWQYEGQAFKAYTDGVHLDATGKGAVAVYRLWIADKDFEASNGSAGGHYYTADLTEYQNMVKLTGVSGEGVAFYGEALGG